MQPQQNILQHKINTKKLKSVWPPPMTSGLEKEWVYCGRSK